MVQEGHGVRRRHPRRAFSKPTRRPPRNSLPTGSRPPRARSRSSSCSISSRATCSAATPRAFAADPLARAVADRALARGFDRAGAARRSGSFSICRSSIPRRSPTRSDAARCFAATGDADLLKWARAARRHHPPVRPLPAPQRRARPRHHARGAGVPRRRRLQGLGRKSARARALDVAAKPALNSPGEF